MGFFSNGTEGEQYEAQWCARCVHNQDPVRGCAVWGAHLFHNYDECNKPDSILHELIPMKDGNNLQCRMFFQRGSTGGGARQRKAA